LKHLPKINIFYWALIVSANTMGETAGDLVSQTFNLGYGGGTIALLALFIIAMLLSLFSKNQMAILYWIVITLASTAGTTIADYLSRTFFVSVFNVSQETGYLLSTIFLLFSIGILFIIWQLKTKNNLLENEFSKSNQLLYWTAILTSSTLGTALGDLLAHDTPLGFDGGTLLLLALLVLVVILTYFTKIARNKLYWTAIILTHPIGATMGDYLTKPEGFNLGNINASLAVSYTHLRAHETN
jgi:uncharacterized membrane-anchored protein